MANSGDSDSPIRPVQDFVVKQGRSQTDQSHRSNVRQNSQVFKPVFPVNVSKELESSVTADQQNVKKRRPPPPVKKRNENVTEEIHKNQQNIQKRRPPPPPVKGKSVNVIKELEKSMGERQQNSQKLPPAPVRQRGPPVKQRGNGTSGMIVKRLAPSIPTDSARSRLGEEEMASRTGVGNSASSSPSVSQNEPDIIIPETLQQTESQHRANDITAHKEIVVAAVIEDVVHMQHDKAEEDNSNLDVLHPSSIPEDRNNSAKLVEEIPKPLVDLSGDGFGESSRNGHSFGTELDDLLKSTTVDPSQRGHFKETYVDHSVSSMSTDGDMLDGETITERLMTLEEIEVGEEEKDSDAEPSPPLSPPSHFGYYSQTSVDPSSGEEDEGDTDEEEDEEDGDTNLLPDVPVIKVEDYSNPALLQGQSDVSTSDSHHGDDHYYHSIDDGYNESLDPSAQGVDPPSNSDAIDKNLLIVGNAIYMIDTDEDSQEDSQEEEEEESSVDGDSDEIVPDDGDSEELTEGEQAEKQSVFSEDEVENEETLEDERMHDSIIEEQEVADADDTSEDSGFAIPASLDEGLAYLGIFSRKLKSELHQLRKQGAVKTGGSESGSERVCHRCRKELGLIFDSGDICPKCNNKVCNDCQVYTPSGKKWFCTICNKQLQIKLGSPDWVGSKTEEDERYPPLHGSQLVKVSLENSRANSTVTSLADENESRRFYEDDLSYSDEESGSYISEEQDPQRSPRRNVTFDSPHHKPASSDLGQGLQRNPKHAVTSNNNEALHKHWHAGSQGWGQNNFSTGLTNTPRNVKRPYERSYSFDKRYVEGRSLHYFDETDSQDFSIVSRGPSKKKEPSPGQAFWWPSGPSANSVDSGVSVTFSGSTCSTGAVDDDSDIGLDLLAEHMEGEGSSGEEEHVKSVSTQTEDRTCEVYLDGKVLEVEAPRAFIDYVVLDTVQEAVIAYDSDKSKSFRNKQPKRLTCDLVGDDAEIKTLLRRDSTGSEKENTPKRKWTFFRSQSVERQKLIPNEPHVFIPVRRAPPLPDSDPSSSSEDSPVEFPDLECSTDSDKSLDLDAKLSDNVSFIQSLVKGMQDEADSPLGGEGVSNEAEVFNDSVSYPQTSMEEEGEPITSLEEVATIAPPKKRLKAPNLNFADSEDEMEVIEDSFDSLKGPDLLLLAALSRASSESDLSVILEDPEEDRPTQKTVSEESEEEEEEGSASTIEHPEDGQYPRPFPYRYQGEYRGESKTKVEVQVHDENGLYVPSTPSPKPVMDTTPRLAGDEWEQMLNGKLKESSEEEEMLEEKEIKKVEMGVQEAESVPQEETGEGLEVNEQEPEPEPATGEGEQVDEEWDNIADEEDRLKIEDEEDEQWDNIADEEDRLKEEDEEEGYKDIDQEAHVVFQEREEDAEKGGEDIEKTEEVNVQMEIVNDEMTEESQEVPPQEEVMTEHLTEVEDPDDSDMVVINYSEDKGVGTDENDAIGGIAVVVTAEDSTEKEALPISPEVNEGDQGTPTEVDVDVHQSTQTEVDVDVHIDVTDSMSHTIQVNSASTLPADSRLMEPEGPGRSATGSFSRRETSGALAKIQKDDFRKASRTSLASLYSNADESYRLPVTGDVNFGTSYNYKTNTFEVKVQSCRDLVPVDAKRNRSNPYVKLYLLPDRSKQSKRKTSVKKSTINPVYAETLRYKIRQSELETRTLCVAVWHYDRFGHNLFLGENLLSLDTIQFDDYAPRWHALAQRQRQSTSALTYTGDVLVAVMYEVLSEDEEKDRSSRYHKGKKNKAPGRMIGGVLHVQIKEAKNLVGMKLGGTSSPVCKCYLLPDRTKHGKKKTSVKKNTCNPKWTDLLKFENVTRDSLLERCLEVTVWDYDSVGSDSLMGGVRLGLGSGKSYGKAVDWMDSSGKEVTVWREMLKNPNHWVETTMTLRGNVGKTKK